MSGKEVLDALMKGMEIEKETFDFYTKAEQKTFNESGKKMFRWLAKTEEQHYLKLTELYNSLNSGGRWVFYGGSTIEAPDWERVTFDTDDADALRLAAEIETRGLDYFQDLLSRTEDAEGKAMLSTLVAEEREHLDVINRRLESIPG